MVTGVEDFGLFVQGIELPAEGLVHVASLDDDYYRYDRARTRWPAVARATAIAWATGAGGGGPGRRRSPRAGFPDRLAGWTGRQAGEAAARCDARPAAQWVWKRPPRQSRRQSGPGKGKAKKRSAASRHGNRAAHAARI